MRQVSALIACMTLGLAAAPARAATVEVEPTTDGQQTLLVYTADAGEANALTVSAPVPAATYGVEDTGAAITAGTGCTLVDAHHATCPAGFAAVVAILDDGDDSATASVAVPVGLWGEDGADRLTGGPDDDLIDGGAGADILAGGGGDYDVADYEMRSDPLTLASDGEPDSGGTLDGVAGARDTIGTDVEILWGGQADDRLTGNDRDNYLWGGAGADVLSGGPGFDYADYSDRDESVTVAPDGQPDSGGTSDGPVGARDTVATDIEGIFGGYGDDRLFGSAVPNYLDAGAGDDLVDSRGGGDDVDVCGDGIDTALADPVIDDVDPTCERINPPPAATPSPTPTPSATPTVSPAAVPAPGRTAPRATFKLPRQTLAHALAHGLRLRVSCSEACRVDATMTLGARTAKTLGLAKTKRAVVVARGAAGSGGSVVVRFTAKARRRLAHVRHVTLTLVVHATDADGNRATIRRTVTLTRSRATLAAAFRWRIRGAPTAALTGR